ncbi:MAG: GxxExxY protein [Candidatus Parcubacteria bacterium]|nr:GxxExxY protein [Candidatus Parcubacteria bacterium]
MSDLSFNEAREIITKRIYEFCYECTKYYKILNMDDKIIYRELSYEIVGVLFEVFDELGYGHKESYYENAVAKGFDFKKIKYKRQIPYKLTFKGKEIGKYVLDFIIEDKIVLEIKRGNYFGKKNIEQVFNYLKVTNLKLAILANFTANGVKFIRIVNSDKYIKQPQEYKLTISKKLLRL